MRFFSQIKPVLLLLLFSMGAVSGYADSYLEHRITASSKLFRSLLAADLELAEKADDSGELILFIITDSDRKHIDITEKFIMGRNGSIGRMPIRLITGTFQECLDTLMDSQSPAGIFLNTSLEKTDLYAIITFSIEHKIVVYSPFEGDVEKGVMAGLAVQAKVQPYLNSATLDASGIKVKNFFLKVSKLYDNNG